MNWRGCLNFLAALYVTAMVVEGRHRNHGAKEHHLHHYRHGDSTARCSRCLPGHFAFRQCHGEEDTVCHECPDGTYSPHHTFRHSCFLCSRCGEGLYVARHCLPTRDTVCDSCHTYRGPHNRDFELKCRRSLITVAQGGFALTDEAETTLASEKTVTPVSEQTVTPATDKTVTPASEQTVTPATDKTVTPVSEQTVTPASKKTVTPASKKTVTRDRGHVNAILTDAGQRQPSQKLEVHRVNQYDGDSWRIVRQRQDGSIGRVVSTLTISAICSCLLFLLVVVVAIGVSSRGCCERRKTTSDGRKYSAVESMEIVAL